MPNWGQIQIICCDYSSANLPISILLSPICVNNIGQISVIHTTHLSSKLAKTNLEQPRRNDPRAPIDVHPYDITDGNVIAFTNIPEFRHISKMTRLSGHPVYYMLVWQCSTFIFYGILDTLINFVVALFS